MNWSALNNYGQLIMNLGALAVLIGGVTSWISSNQLHKQEEKKTQKAADERAQLKASQQPEAIASAVSKVKVSEFMTAIESGASLDTFFPEIYNHDIGDAHYPELLGYYFGAEYGVKVHIGVIIANNFPVKAAAHRLFREDALSWMVTNRTSRQFQEELLVTILKSAIANPTGKDQNIAENLVFTGFHDFSIEVIYRRFPDKRPEMRKWLETSGKNLGLGDLTIQEKIESFDALEST